MVAGAVAEAPLMGIREDIEAAAARVEAADYEPVMFLQAPLLTGGDLGPCLVDLGPVGVDALGAPPPATAFQLERDDALGVPPAGAPLEWTWAGSLADHTDAGSYQLGRLLDAMIVASLQRERALVDLACVEALCLRVGCRVTVDAFGLPVAAAPDAAVPYLQVYYVPQGVDLPEREG